jgi:hypothetical protein
MVAVTCFVSARLPVYAGDKDKQDKDKKGKDDKGKDDKKQDDKKGDDKKGDEKKGTVGEVKFKAFEGKDPFYQEVETKTKQVMKVMNQEVTQNQDQTFFIKWSPQEKDKDGNYVVKQEIIGVVMKIDIGGNKIEFDSRGDKSKQQKNPMTDFFNALMSQSLTFTVSPSLDVKKIEGRTEFIKKLSETNPAIKSLLDQIMSEEALKKMAEPTWFAVPSEKDKTWTKDSTLELGPLGTYKTSFNFTNEGTKGDIDTIKIEAQLKYTEPKEGKGVLPFTIKKATLESKEGKGTANFNRAKGRIDSSELTMKLDGELKIEVGNMETDIKLTQDQTSKTKSFDKNPLEK